MDDLVAFLRARNRVVHGIEEPSAEQIGRWFDQRFGLWLPVEALRTLKRRGA